MRHAQTPLGKFAQIRKSTEGFCVVFQQHFRNQEGIRLRSEKVTL